MSFIRFTTALALAFTMSTAVACGQAFTAGSATSDAGGGGSGSGSGNGSGGSSGSGSSSGSSIDAGEADAIGVVDAAACQGAMHCVPGVPVGWSGPVELYDGTITSPPCDTGFSQSPAYDGNDQLSAGPATCGCTCGGASGVQCAAPTLSVYGGTSCGSQNSCTSHILTDGQCTSIDLTSGCSGGPALVSLSMDQGTPSGGSCLPQASKMVPLPSWAAAGRACTPAAQPTPAGCPGQAVCAPRSSSPYLSGLCIMRAGDVTCPPAGYTVQHVLYGGVDDTRDCSACSCGPVSAASCDSTLETFASGSTNCGGIANTLTAPFMCSNGIAAQQTDVMLKMSPTGGSCTASGGQPTGTATAANPTTFCCLP